MHLHRVYPFQNLNDCLHTMAPAVCLTFPVGSEGGDGGVMKTILRSAPEDAEAPSKENYVCVGTCFAKLSIFFGIKRRRCSRAPLMGTSDVCMQCITWGRWRMGHSLIAAEKTIHRAHTAHMRRLLMPHAHVHSHTFTHIHTSAYSVIHTQSASACRQGFL